MKNELTQTLSWEIETSPVIISGQENLKKKALVRSDDGKLLGIRSNKYYPVFNRDLEAIKERILDSNKFTFKGFQEFQHGKRILSFFENNRNDFNICGEPVKDYLIIGNSNDATSKLFVGTSNFMFRCENQFSEKIRSFELIHNRPFNIEEIKFDQIMNIYETGRTTLYSNMERLKQLPASMTIIRQLAEKLLKTEQNLDRLEINEVISNTPQNVIFLNCIEKEISDLGSSYWGIFNGVTRYTSNHLNGNQGFGVVNGKGEKMNREAMRYLLSGI